MVAAEAAVKGLAEMKSYLEKRIAESEQEISRLRSFLEVIDEILADSSFRKVEIGRGSASSVAGIDTKPFQPLEAKVQVAPLQSESGVHLADLVIGEGQLRVTPDASLSFDVNAPPMSSFLIGRILEPMQSRDRQAAETGDLPKEKVLSYVVREENGILKEISIANYGDQRRLAELKSAIRWALRRIYERTPRPQ